jgi:hypothetical protein
MNSTSERVRQAIGRPSQSGGSRVLAELEFLPQGARVSKPLVTARYALAPGAASTSSSDTAWPPPVSAYWTTGPARHPRPSAWAPAGSRPRSCARGHARRPMGTLRRPLGAAVSGSCCGGPACRDQVICRHSCCRGRLIKVRLQRSGAMTGCLTSRYHQPPGPGSSVTGKRSPSSAMPSGRSSSGRCVRADMLAAAARRGGGSTDCTHRAGSSCTGPRRAPLSDAAHLLALSRHVPPALSFRPEG